MKIETKQTDIVQAYDYSIDREYYKKSGGFIFSYTTLVRTDRLKNWKQWNIICEELPDDILINGNKYKLIND